MASANRVVASDSIARSGGSQYSWTDKLLMEGILTCVTATHRRTLTLAKRQERTEVLD